MAVFLRPENGGDAFGRSYHGRAPLADAGSADLLGSRLALAPALRTRLPQDRPVSRGRCRNPIPTDPTTRAVGNATGAESLPHLLRALETSEDEDLERMHAFRVADRWGADRLRTLKLFLHAANAGLLDVSWDVIGPSCLGAKVRESRLRDLRNEAHCNACNIGYTADFAEFGRSHFSPERRNPQAERRRLLQRRSDERFPRHRPATDPGRRDPHTHASAGTVDLPPPFTEAAGRVLGPRHLRK